MAHESLYRKYRPSSFDEVVGQDQITRPLAEALRAGKVGHAYLFSGSRGLGKTSVARIFAREINKDRYDEHDVHEIDAASSNSVEDVRSLTEGVYTLPFGSDYKVYILDEVHMLSKAAWNAFLKTLEEPPPHAVFILATTELERVPETVQSRCQVFEFKKPTRAELAAVVADVAKKEGYTLQADAADLVARLANGSYRDALSVLQRMLVPLDGSSEAFGVSETNSAVISREDVEKLTGAPARELVQALIGALAKGERGAALADIETAALSGADMKLFLELLIESLRAALLIRYAPEMRASFKSELGVDEYAALESLAKEQGITHAVLVAFLTASERMRYAPILSLPLELAVFELFPENEEK